MSASLSSNLAKFGRILPKQSALLLCDMQEKFRPSIKYFDEIVHNSNRLLKAAKILDVPVFCTEQYPKGLGKTVAELEVTSYDVKPIEKTKFSMCLAPIVDELKKKEQQNVDSIILCGIEAHVCIQQSAIDFRNMGFQVFIVADACSSRGIPERHFAFDLMSKAGCWLSTTESVILSWAGDSSHPRFKEIQSIIRNPGPDAGLNGVAGFPSKI